MRKTFSQRVHSDLKQQAAGGAALDVLLETRDALGHVKVDSTVAYLPRDRQHIRRAILSMPPIVSDGPRKAGHNLPEQRLPGPSERGDRAK